MNVHFTTVAEPPSRIVTPPRQSIDAQLTPSDSTSSRQNRVLLQLSTAPSASCPNNVTHAAIASGP